MLSKITNCALLAAATQALLAETVAEAEVPWTPSDKPDFTSTIRVAATSATQNPKYLCVEQTKCYRDGTRPRNGDDIPFNFDVRLCYGTNSEKRAEWNFYLNKDTGRWSIQNVSVKDHGCGEQFLYQKDNCDDPNIIRSFGQYFDTTYQELALVSAGAPGSFYIQDPVQAPNCARSYLRSQDNSGGVEWWEMNDNNRTVWYVDIPQKKLIHTVMGRWVLFASGTDAIEAELSREVTTTKGKTTTSEFDWGFELSVSAKIGTDDNNVEVGASYSHSESEAEAISSQLSDSSSTKCSAKCANKAGARTRLWQYTRTGQSSENEIQMSTCNYACTYDATTTPSCVPSACTDEACVVC